MSGSTAQHDSPAPNPWMFKFSALQLYTERKENPVGVVWVRSASLFLASEIQAHYLIPNLLAAYTVENAVFKWQVSELIPAQLAS